MNASDTLDYTLGQLEGEAAEEASRQVDNDPALADRVERLGRSLELLLDDGEDAYAPPLDLARAALAFVGLAARERPTVLELAPAPAGGSAGDFAMAATIFLASLLALAPAILRGKERWGPRRARITSPEGRRPAPPVRGDQPGLSVRRLR